MRMLVEDRSVLKPGEYRMTQVKKLMACPLWAWKLCISSFSPLHTPARKDLFTAPRSSWRKDLSLPVLVAVRFHSEVLGVARAAQGQTTQKVRRGIWSRAWAACSLSQLLFVLWVNFEREELRLGWTVVPTGGCMSRWEEGNVTTALTQVRVLRSASGTP